MKRDYLNSVNIFVRSKDLGQRPGGLFLIHSFDKLIRPVNGKFKWFKNSPLFVAL